MAKVGFTVPDDAHPDAATYIALFAFAADRQPDAVIRAIGTEAVTAFPLYQMDMPNRVAEFVAQTAHETGGYTHFTENLNYSAQGLANTWPNRFATDPHAKAKQPNARAVAVAHQPESIANIVYARPKEGNVNPGDGWRYRGRGMLQLTFRNNYKASGDRIGQDLVNHPDLAADPAVSLHIALDFWKRCACNDCCDAGDFYGARGLTNCGSKTPPAPPIGLEDVAVRRARLLPLFA
ncbi:glycoside hydrolase family 19 protein [Sphingomonas nostoxanthinifaciens]|uniref:glycoside hydrolase family 19 protein n=1 Tax=Sphingomonas nostoxanthinifaciens TaxID=2872652 RepID=UPI001CC20C1D|nr:glycoside hydrolase family 19 protein [Sphingomonas nostoxanthinifaciens]UAK23955.1 hypothetical protein K8P63_16580 [Sphingomonas nostoxanthinifaciens]